MINKDLVSIENYDYYINELENGYDNLINQLYGDNNAIFYPISERNNYIFIRLLKIGYENKSENIINKIIYSLYGIGSDFSIVFQYLDNILFLYIGAERKHIDEIYRILNGYYNINSDNNSQYYEVSNDYIFDTTDVFNYSGILYGNINIEGKETCESSLIDKLVASSVDSDFTIIISAHAISRKEIFKIIEPWNKLNNLSKLITSRQVSVHDEIQSVSYSDVSHKVLKLIDLCEKFYNHFSDSLCCGMWDVSIKYFSNSESVPGIIIAETYGKDVPISMHKISKIRLEYDNSSFKDINCIEILKNDSLIKFDFPKFSNLYSSDELSVIVDFPRKEHAGIEIFNMVDFDVAGGFNENLKIGDILYRNNVLNIKYSIDVNELNRHTLVVGKTGSGKTNTIKNIIIQLYNKFPFMIIEPAKKEYWELYKYGCDDLVIYSPGIKGDLLQINPFKKGNNIGLQTHIDYIFAAFKASFIMYPPMPYVLENSIYEIYKDCGWDIENDVCYLGEEYPTIEQLFYKIPDVVQMMGYDTREQSNIIGALQSRINSLRHGSKGNVLNVKDGCSIEELLNKNVIIELENIGDEDTKAFIISMILIQVLEARINSDDCQLEIKHEILIEEAHRLLKNITSGTGENADPRGNAVEFFCNMLAELRSKGQGFIIADQIPTKLAPDVIKNTNIKIVHRLSSEDDSESIGKSMHMTDEQIEHLSSLKQGIAAVYSENDNRPKLIKSDYAGDYMILERKNYSYPEVKSICRPDILSACVNQKQLNYICRICPFNCRGIKERITENEFTVINYDKYIEQIISNLNDNTYLSALNNISKEAKDVYNDQIKIYKTGYCFTALIVEKLDIKKEKFLKNLTLALKNYTSDIIN